MSQMELQWSFFNEQSQNDSKEILLNRKMRENPPPFCHFCLDTPISLPTLPYPTLPYPTLPTLPTNSYSHFLSVL